MRIQLKKRPMAPGEERPTGALGETVVDEALEALRVAEEEGLDSLRHINILKV